MDPISEDYSSTKKYPLDTCLEKFELKCDTFSIKGNHYFVPTLQCVCLFRDGIVPEGFYFNALIKKDGNKFEEYWKATDFSYRLHGPYYDLDNDGYPECFLEDGACGFDLFMVEIGEKGIEFKEIVEHYDCEGEFPNSYSIRFTKILLGEL